jgi:hypothetical protein
MDNPLSRRDSEPEIFPATKLQAKIAGLFTAPYDHFETRPHDTLDLTFDGIEGDFHSGSTRKSGSREPWYPRGTEMRNERQLTIVSPDDLSMIASGMGIAEVRPEWIGANILLEGIERLSMLPRGTLMFFKGGVTLKIDDQNGPCKLSGRAVAENAGMDDVNAGALLFPKVAKRLRGILAWVEKPGRITVGEEVLLRLPEQWIYRP